MLAAQSIKALDQQVVVAGGQESMSNAVFYVYGMRGGVKAGDQTLVDGLIKDGLWDSFNDVHMGGLAEYTAKKAHLTRAMQDEFALASHRKAVAAMDHGLFRDEIVPVEIPGRKGPTMINADESPRRDTSMEVLSKLKPAFPKDAPKDMKPEELTVTAGNAPGLNDGASALVVASEAYAKAHGLGIMARITGYATGGGEPKDLFFAPIFAVQNLMRMTGMKIGDFDLIEANEAFAAQACAVTNELKLDPSKVNPNGSGISLGHPIGATGALITVKALYELQRIGGRYALVTMCIGGGQGIAAIFERV
jgi:acetyl-CoA C-acetyltransferase